MAGGGVEGGGTAGILELLGTFSAVASVCADRAVVATSDIPGAGHEIELPGSVLVPIPSLAMHVETGSKDDGAGNAGLEQEMADSGDPGTGR